MSFADTTRCEHGITFAEECEHCEIIALRESLTWMTRRVKRNEKRLAELQDKLNPIYLTE